MDASRLIPNGYHPMRNWTEDGIQPISACLRRCKVAPMRYYFIDFQFSMFFPERETARVTGRWGQIKTIPEMQKPDPYNPFKSDVYQVAESFLMFFKVGFSSI